MNDIKIVNRYTYRNTLALWKTINAIIQKHLMQNDKENLYIMERDNIIFQLAYSYGLKINEILNLKLTDLNFNKESNNKVFGSIFISSSYTDKNRRLVYPIFSDITQLIIDFLAAYMTQHSKYQIIFTTIKGTPITENYIISKFKYYNSLIPSTNKINSIYYLRLMYITDLLRIKGLSQTFINSQIGNNTINNQLYYNLKPNNGVV